MSQQPSVNDIASLYRGNPQALQARMQKEPQVVPGIPADLKQLLALNIVTNEENGMARQQAMQQLNQMAPQGPDQMATVAQSIQEQAKQKLQAQMMQQQQQQQAMQQMSSQARASSVPPGTPQPQRQPQGIDELPVEFGLAGGGIVAFEEGGRTKYETRYDRMTRENRGELTEEERAAQEARDALIAQIPSGGPTVTGGERVDSSETERNIRNILSALPGAGAAKATTLGRQALAGISGLLGLDRSNAPDEERVLARAQAPQQAAEAIYSNEGRTGARPYTPTPAPTRDLRQLAEQRQRTIPAPAAPVAQVAAAAPTSTPQEDYLNKVFSMDPEVARQEKIARTKAAIPAPDFTQRNAAISALEEERRRNAEPEAGFGSLMEYLGQVAATPRGMTSFEAGAAGARGQQALQKQRSDQRMALGMKIIEQEQGKIDATREYAKDVFGVGEKEFDRIFDTKLKVADKITDNKLARDKLAQELTLKDMDIKQRQAEEKGRVARHIVPLEQQVFPALLKQAGGDAAKAYEMLKSSGVAGERNDISAIKNVQSGLLKELSENIRMDAATRAKKQAQLDQTYVDLARLGGAKQETGGSPITRAEYDKLPKGATYTAPDGTQRTKG